jgi:hypothetical protein
MNFFDHRQIRTTCTVHAFHLPQKGYIGGYFSGAKPARDVQNINNTKYDRNIQKSGYSAASGSTNTSVSVSKDNKIYNQSQNLRDLREFQGGLMALANPNNGASLCTFARGGIVNGEIHPVFNTLRGTLVTATYENSDKEISTQTGTATTNVKANNYPFIPFKTDSKLNNNQVFDCYNIWGIDGVNDTKVDKYIGPIVDSDLNIRTILDTNNGPILDIASVNGYLKAYRLYPTSKDVIYQKPSLYFESKANTWKTVSVNANGSKNAGFMMKLACSTPSKDSFIEVGIEDKANSSTKLNISSYRIKYFQTTAPYLSYINPITKEEILYAELTGFPTIQDHIELYVHFVGGCLLLGSSPDSTGWKLIPPIEIDSSGKLYEHSIGSEVVPYVAVNNLNVQLQYGGIVFNHLNEIDPENKEHKLYLYNEFKAPKEKQDKISTQNVLANVFDNVYYGNFHKNIESYNEPITIYGDYRTVNQFSSFDTGLSSDGSLSVKNGVGIESTGRIDGSIYIRLSNNPGLLSQFNNKPINSKNDEVNYNVNSSDIVTNVSNTSTYDDILTYIDGADLSSYLQSWNVDVQCENPNLSRISKTAEITLFNVDNTSDGLKIIDLLERNLLVIKLTAGYGSEQYTYFEGFCTEISVEKSGSETKFSLSCQDISTFVLSNIYFEFPLLLTGLSIFRASDYIIACSGFADHYYRLPGNNRYNFFGSLKLDPNAVQRQDVMVCQITDKILEKLDTVLGLLFNKKAYPTLRWDENTHKLIFDARHNYLDSDFKFIGTIETKNDEIISIDSNYQKNVPDWHGLLSGSYNITIQNGDLAAGVKSFGLTLDGFKVMRTPESRIQTKLDSNARNRIVNALSSNVPVAGYIGFRKYIIDANDKASIPSEQILKNRYDLLSIVSSTTLHNINFTCYVTKPLRPYGTFLINLLLNDKTSQTDPYIYQKVSYSFSKENNYITATVTGFNDILPIIKG